jgi:hypothetical protein
MLEDRELCNEKEKERKRYAREVLAVSDSEFKKELWNPTSRSKKDDTPNREHYTWTEKIQPHHRVASTPHILTVHIKCLVIRRIAVRHELAVLVYELLDCLARCDGHARHGHRRLRRPSAARVLLLRA